ncbi:MAG: flagellar hook-basal body complex protein FliE [Bdellovibrio sp.]|nr:MAG: flagellar hook-basal body complex protein FliE [Bdellovibrio sp.]
MDGLTIKNTDRFLEPQGIRDSQHFEQRPGGPGASEGANDVSFADTLNQAIQGVNQLQRAADKGMQELATGRTENIADVMIATEKADIALKLMVQVRNKIIDAYQEIMKMQV